MFTFLDIQSMGALPGTDSAGVSPWSPSWDPGLLQSAVLIDDYAADTSTTGQVAVGGSVTGNLERNGDHDWFRVQLVAGHNYIISQRGVFTGGSLQYPDVSLHDAAGVEVAHDAYHLRDPQLGVHASATGTFYIDAGGDHNLWAGTYTIDVRDLGTDTPTRFDPNPLTAISGNFGPSAQGWTSENQYPRFVADMDGTGTADVVGFGDGGVFTSLSGFGTAGQPGFAGSFLISSFFGASAANGGWTSQDLYPRALADVNHDNFGDIIGFASDGVYVSICNFNFVYNTPVRVLDTFVQSASGGGWSSQDKYPRVLGDVNGDGSADIVAFGEAGVYVALATPGTGSGLNGGFGPPAYASPFFSIANFGVSGEAGGFTSQDRYPRFVADVNGDAKADIVAFATDGVFVSLATDAGHFSAPTEALATFGTSLEAGGWASENLYPRELADVNADGRADIVGFGDIGVFVALANADGTFASPTTDINRFGSSPSAGNWSSFDLYPRLFGDVTGDHRADLIAFGDTSVYLSQSHDFLPV